MLGIRKECLIKILQTADVEIVTDLDLQDIFIDCGEECEYNSDGIVAFIDKDDNICK